jgi:hypothetical protein
MVAALMEDSLKLGDRQKDEGERPSFLKKRSKRLLFLSS